MTDWTPVLVGAGAVLLAVAHAIPIIVMIFQHRSTRAEVRDNSKTLGRVEAQTNGAADVGRAAVISLRAEVVAHELRLAALEAAHAAGKGPHHDNAS